MPVDPQMQAILNARAGLPPLHTLSVEAARARLKAPRPPGLRVEEVAAVADRTIPGPGGLLRLRVYTPPGGTGPLPLLVFFHGGGFVIGDLDTHDPLCRNLCAGAGCMVMSVDYRLAPEHRFPAASNDCLAATRWAAEHAAELGVDPSRVAVAGDSAGGNLAAVTAIRVRDEGGPRLAGQLLVYPNTDLGPPTTASFVEYAEGYGLTARDVPWFFGRYLADPAEEAWHPHVSPLRVSDLRGLPPALVVTAECDVVRDDGERFAERLREAGVPTTLSRFDGVIHGFFTLAGLLVKADVAQAEACAWLRGIFAERS
jgi:acetyl esterase